MMRTTTILMAIAVVTVTIVSTQAGADSIWAKASPRMKDIYADDTARNVGDLLTIKIDEKSSLSRDTDRDMNKDTSRSANMAGTLNLGDIAGRNVASKSAHTFDFAKLDFASNSSNKFQGGSKVSADRSITDYITVTVEDVLPNGNLLVVGKRMRTIIGETQMLQISGVVRPNDIAFDNTINSSKVADFHLVWTTDSAEKNFTNPGWLGRIANFMNPF